MMPHQIYCDYLEDKGIDTRLLRIEDDSVVFVATSLGNMVERWHRDDLATGRNFNYTNWDGGWSSGDGTGYGYGFGAINGNGSCSLGRYL